MTRTSWRTGCAPGPPTSGARSCRPGRHPTGQDVLRVLRKRRTDLTTEDVR
ncbi:hypothetical protein K7G98_00475 [Saccharothrix sp. MB29]|nr:hypothetical protein [Saccharothrix sp. MB29]